MTPEDEAAKSITEAGFKVQERTESGRSLYYAIADNNNTPGFQTKVEIAIHLGVLERQPLSVNNPAFLDGALTYFKKRGGGAVSRILSEEFRYGDLTYIVLRDANSEILKQYLVTFSEIDERPWKRNR